MEKQQIMIIVAVLVVLCVSSSLAGAGFFMTGDSSTQPPPPPPPRMNIAPPPPPPPPPRQSLPEPELELAPEMKSPADLLSTFKNSGKQFQMGIYNGGELQCVRIKMGGDDRFDNKDDVEIRGCDASDQPQLWRYDGNKIKTVKNDKKGRTLCLDNNGEKFKVTKCDDKPQENRTYKLMSVDDADVQNVDGEPRWESSHTTVSNAIPVYIQSDKDQKCIAGTNTGACNTNATRLYIMS